MTYQSLVQRSMTDPTFRATLLADPHSALAQDGINVPPGVTVSVLTSTPEQLVLALPPLVPSAAAEETVDEDELAAVSGGGMTWVPATVIGLWVAAVGTTVVVATNDARKHGGLGRE